MIDQTFVNHTSLKCVLLTQSLSGVPEVMHRLSSGESVPFGKELALKRDGFRHGQQAIAWSDIRAMKIPDLSANNVKGSITISCPGAFHGRMTKSVSWEIGNVKNPHILKEIVERLVIQAGNWVKWEIVKAQ